MMYTRASARTLSLFTRRQINAEGFISGVYVWRYRAESSLRMSTRIEQPIAKHSGTFIIPNPHALFELLHVGLQRSAL